MKYSYNFLSIVFLIIFSLRGYSQSVPSYVPTNGLVGWWGFNGNAQDGSGNGNHGTVNGPTLTTDRFGNQDGAYSFDGIDDWVQVNDDSSLRPGLLTLSAWVYTTQNSANPIITKMRIGNPFGPDGGEQYCLFHSQYNTQNAAGSFQIKREGACVNGGVGWQRIMQNNLNFGLGNWHHLAGTYDGTIMKLYINGQLSGSFNPPSGPIDDCANGSFNIGRGWVNFDFFSGIIDDIGIWDRALTQQEITNLYNSQSCQVNVNSQPQNQSTLPNRNVTFLLTSSDSSSTYQWESNSGFGFQPLFNAGQYSGVNTSSLTVSNTSMQNNNQLFRCIVNTNACGRDTSDVATLSVNASSSSTSIPKRFNYQSVIRDTSGGLVTNRTIGLKMTLSRGPHLGDLYSETHQLTSNSNGLITSSVGGGTPVLGSMDSIDWSLGDVYIKTEVDLNGGTNYVVLNTNQLLSVPYSLYSLNSGNSVPGPVGPQGPQGIQGVQGNDGAVGPPGQSVSSKPIFINPQVLFSFSGNSLNWGTSRIDTINFNYLLNQNVSSVILFYEYTPAAYGYPNAPVEFGASAQINSITYTYGGSNRMDYGQVILPISSSGEVYFGTSITSFGNFSLKIQGYYP